LFYALLLTSFYAIIKPAERTRKKEFREAESDDAIRSRESRQVVTQASKITSA